MIAEAYAGFPNEACGLLGGDPDGQGELFVACRNLAESSRTFELGIDQVKAERQIEDAGGEIIAVVHSHTHTDAYPSPTDVRQAVDPAWWYVIVSLKQGEPVLRAFQIRDETITEVPVQVG